MENSVVAKFEAYLLTEKCVSSNTFSAYKRDIKQFTNFLKNKNLVLENTSKKHVKDFLSYLKDRHLSARSMSRKISCLKVFFSYLHQQLGWENIAADLTFPKIEKKIPHYLSETQIQQLLNVAEEDASNRGIRNKVMLYLLYVSGMRISELTNLKISDIHFDTGFISVCGKGGKGRMIPILQSMISLLHNYIRTIRHTYMTNKKGEYTIDYLFPVLYAGKIKAISRQAYWTILKQLCVKTGIKKSISPHTLRHSLATHMLKKGMNLRSLQMLLGHENLATVQVYTHVETSYLRKIYDKKHPRS